MTTPPLRTQTSTFDATDDLVDATFPARDASPAGMSRAQPGSGSSTTLDEDVTLAVLVQSSGPERTNRAQVAGERAAGNGAALRAQVAVQSETVAALVDRASVGDPRAWEELVARFGGMIAATGRRYRLTPADIAELQQTTWLRLVENLHRIEQPERVGGWLATTARRESLQLLRRAAKYHGGADQMLANMPDKHLPEPDARPIADERDAVLKAAWDRLKPRCQELLSLLVADDPMGYKDLSKLLQMPVGSIGPTRGRCLEHLRRLVAEEGLTTL
jgi:RNA polymerase sigma factor (sigma-70 family)